MSEESHSLAVRLLAASALACSLFGPPTGAPEQSDGGSAGIRTVASTVTAPRDNAATLPTPSIHLEVTPVAYTTLAPAATHGTAHRAKRTHARKYAKPSKSRKSARLKRKPRATHRTRPAVRTANAVTGVWGKLAECEAGGNWAANTGNGFYGGLQFTPETWKAYGGNGSAHEATSDEQIAVAERVKAAQGWGAWPACSRKLGLRG